jgi:hypothetical protein
MNRDLFGCFSNVEAFALGILKLCCRGRYSDFSMLEASKSITVLLLVLLCLRSRTTCAECLTGKVLKELKKHNL